MIKFITKINDENLLDILDFIKNNYESDFYITHDNERVYINTITELRSTLKNSIYISKSEDTGNINGILFLWKGIGGNVNRYYVKLNVLDKNIADRLIKVLCWNVDRDLYGKLNKESPYIQVFKDNGFRWNGYRGSQVLLSRIKNYRRKENVSTNI